MATTFTSCWIIKTTSFPVQTRLSFLKARILPNLQPADRRSHSFLTTPRIFKLVEISFLDVKPDNSTLVVGLLSMSKPNLQHIIKFPKYLIIHR